MTPSPLAIYIHWPFCLSKCPYCDFNSHVRERVDQARWQAALLKELDTMAARIPGRSAASIFFGGGTPSLMPAATVGALIDRVHALWPADPAIEITLEANPTSAEARRFREFRQAGVNRLSIGVQSLRDDGLRLLGRGHSAREALAAVALAGEIFDRYSFDLIYARTHQTPAAWEAELREALRHAGGHLSLYQLTIEEQTAFHALHAKGELPLPDEHQAEALYRLTESLMEEHGLPAYEVSNYARPGEESRHNLAYWQGDDYLGIGPGAHGRLSITLDVGEVPPHPLASHRPSGGDTQAVKRLGYLTSSPLEGGGRIATAMIKSPERWLEAALRDGHGLEQWQVIERRQDVEERVMMGLRRRGGIGYDAFQAQTGYDLRSYLNISRRDLCIAQGLLENDDTRLTPTLGGRLVLNTLTAELLI